MGKGKGIGRVKTQDKFASIIAQPARNCSLRSSPDPPVCFHHKNAWQACSTTTRQFFSPWSDTTDMDDRRGAACVHDGFAVAGGLSLLSPNVALMSYLGPRQPFSFQVQMFPS